MDSSYPVNTVNESEMKYMEENSKHKMTEQQKERILEQLWLTYYNDTLYGKGVITETEHNKMRVKIKTRDSGMER